MAGLLLKSGVRFAPYAPGGGRLLGALLRTALRLNLTLTLTAAANGTHAKTSRHPKDEAYDVRTKHLTEAQKDQLVRQLARSLQDDPADDPALTSGGWATSRFYAFVEARGTANEHLHCQVRKGRVYP